MKVKSDHDCSFVESLCEQLADIGELRPKRMFGGYGLYAGDVFFGIVHKGCLYFKTDENTKRRYIQQGMDCFRPNEKQCLRHYFQVPIAIIEDAAMLHSWAIASINIAGT